MSQKTVKDPDESWGSGTRQKILNREFCQDVTIIQDQFLLRQAKYKGTFVFLYFGRQNNRNVLMK